jgi:hypothetical protein
VVSRNNIGILLFVVLAAGFALFRLLPGEEKEIRKQLAVFERTAAKKSDEQPVESLLKARRIAGLFNDPCQFSVDAADFTGTFSRQQIMERINLVRASYGSVTVKLYDIAIEFPEENRAAVRLTLRLSGQSREHAVADVQETLATLEKIEGDWLFTTVRIVEVLSR